MMTIATSCNVQSKCRFATNGDYLVVHIKSLLIMHRVCQAVFLFVYLKLFIVSIFVYFNIKL